MSGRRDGLRHCWIISSAISQLFLARGLLASGANYRRASDAGSCNGCELEIHALGNVYYDLERFGLRFVASPGMRTSCS